MNKKITTENKPYGFGEVMSMLEAMNDGIQMISEQHGEVINRLDNLDGRVDKLDSRMDKLDSRMDKLDSRMDKLDNRMDKLDSRMDKLQDDVTEIKHKLSQKVDLEDFQKLEKRLLHVEKIVLNFSQKH